MLASPCKALFVSHGGGPLPLLDSPEHHDQIEMLRSVGHLLDGAKGIILFSAHWETPTPYITASKHPGIYFDYEPMRNELPTRCFDFEFPTTYGDSQLAHEIAKCLNNAGLKPVIDTTRGWDQGVFVPMALMRSNWDIPLVQMSVLTGEDDADSTMKNLALGKAMRTFVERGYTVVGSGSSSHDFKAIRQAVVSGQSIESEAWAFEEAMKSTASIKRANVREKMLSDWINWESRSSAHLDGHVEHFMPFIITAACVGDEDGERVGWCGLAGTPQSAFCW